MVVEVVVAETVRVEVLLALALVGAVLNGWAVDQRVFESTAAVQTFVEFGGHVGQGHVVEQTLGEEVGVEFHFGFALAAGCLARVNPAAVYGASTTYATEVLVASLHVVRIDDAAVVERVGAPQVSGFEALGFGAVLVADGLEFFVERTAVILHGHVVSHLRFCIVHVQIGSFALCGSSLFGLLNLLVVGRQVPFGDPDFVEVSLGLVGA